MLCVTYNVFQPGQTRYIEEGIRRYSLHSLLATKRKRNALTIVKDVRCCRVMLRYIFVVVGNLCVLRTLDIVVLHALLCVGGISEENFENMSHEDIESCREVVSVFAVCC